MPLTFPSHPGAVLALKLWWPRWFDGVALALGAMAPDLAYAFDGMWLERPVPSWPPLWQIAHSWWGVVWWMLPVTVMGGCVARWAAPTVAAHLPGVLRGYGAIGAGPRWYVTAWSAAIGGASHVLWDRLAVGALDGVSSVVGAMVAVGVVLRYGRRLEFVGVRRPARFWVVTGVVFLTGVAVVSRDALVHTLAARVLIVAGVALCAGSVAARVR